MQPHRRDLNLPKNFPHRKYAYFGSENEIPDVDREISQALRSSLSR